MHAHLAYTAALAVITTVLGCAAPTPAGDTETAATGAGAAAAGATAEITPAAASAVRDTGTAGLPRSILGQAPPPQGSAVHYFAADPATTGYLALPSGNGPFPAVILIHEWNGLVDRVRKLADDLAERGYVALAADLYSGRTGSSPDENRALMREVQADSQRIIANLDAAADFLRERADVTGRIATIGWCFGGGVALSYAIGGDHHEGTAIFYGSLVTDPARLRSIDHAVYGTFAAEDQGIPPAQVERFAAALRSAGVENDIHVYDDVEHGFWLWVDEDPETRLAPARHAWDRLEAYLGRTIGGGMNGVPRAGD